MARNDTPRISMARNDIPRISHIRSFSRSLSALVVLLVVEIAGAQTCEDQQSCGRDGEKEEQIFGSDIMIDAHTVLLTQGTEAEVTSPQWASRFPLTYIAEGDTCQVHGWKDREEKRVVWDAFTFFNELQVLELRLRTLDTVVDRFVLVESTRTHSNLPKPLYYQQAAANFSGFHHKIVHVIVEDLPDSDDSWVLEHFQREAIRRGLVGAGENDIVFVSDVDEIPNPQVVSALALCAGWDETGPVLLYTRFYNFKFSFQFEAQWHHPQAAVWGWVRRNGAEGLRMHRSRPEHLRLEDAGWHLSFFADAPGVQQKIRAYAHQEFNRAEMLDLDAIEAAILHGTDYFYAHGKGEERFGAMVHNPSCFGLPPYAVQNPDKYKHWLPDCDAADEI